MNTTAITITAIICFTILGLAVISRDWKPKK